MNLHCSALELGSQNELFSNRMCHDISGLLEITSETGFYYIANDYFKVFRPHRNFSYNMEIALTSEARDQI